MRRGAFETPHGTRASPARWAGSWRDSGQNALSLLIGAALWELAGRVMHFSFLPPLSAVLKALGGLIASGAIFSNLARSLGSLAIGFALAVVCGVTLGLMMGRCLYLEYALEPILHALLATPKLAFVPLVYALFGLSRSTQVVVVFISCVFTIAINAMAGMHSASATHVEMARSFGARESQLFWKVLLPGSLPLTLAGLRLGMGQAVKGMISGEMFIAFFGLGALLRKYGGRFDSERVFAILLVVVAVALACSWGIEKVERRLTAWMGDDS
jgi:NitT/TauT family transport system permease protein